jgi:hypothetical protein
MPGVLIAQNTGLRARGGGKTLYFRQILRLADGSAFAALTGNDCFGDAAGEWHIAGTHTKTDWNRDDNGVNALDFQIVECDVDHNNLTINAAPITDIDATQPELEAEDGTQIVTNRLPQDEHPVLRNRVRRCSGRRLAAGLLLRRPVQPRNLEGSRLEELESDQAEDHCGQRTWPHDRYAADRCSIRAHRSSDTYDELAPRRLRRRVGIKINPNTNTRQNGLAAIDEHRSITTLDLQKRS